MPASPDLEALRREIDDCDEALHAALMRRAAAVLAVGQAKRDAAAPVHRPAREAQILRRLVAAHEGAFPKPALVRIWRELIAASVAIQGDFRAACADAAAVEAARGHFGDVTPVVDAADPLAAVIAGDAEAALLPWPGTGGDGGHGDWWLRLAAAGGGESGVALLWRLPFTGGPPAWAVVGRGIVAESGDDRTWFAVSDGDLERANGDNPLHSAGFSDTQRLAQANAHSLIDVPGFVPPDAVTRQGGGEQRANWLGAYPLPLDL